MAPRCHRLSANHYHSWVSTARHSPHSPSRVPTAHHSLCTLPLYQRHLIRSHALCDHADMEWSLLLPLLSPLPTRCQHLSCYRASPHRWHGWTTSSNAHLRTLTPRPVTLLWRICNSSRQISPRMNVHISSISSWWNPASPRCIIILLMVMMKIGMHISGSSSSLLKVEQFYLYMDFNELLAGQVYLLFAICCCTPYLFFLLPFLLLLLLIIL